MAKGITIPIASDTREFTSQVQNGVIKPLEGVDKALDEVARGGDAAGKKLEHSLDGAQRETSAFKKQQQDLGKTITASQQHGTQAYALSTRQRLQLSRTAIRQAGATAKQQLAGDIQSMDGTASGAVGALGNTVGGILASFGPMAAGIGVAVGVATGIVTGMLAKTQAQTKKAKADVKALGQEFIDTAGVGERSISAMTDKLKELALANEDGQLTLSQLRQEAKDAGLDFEDIAVAYVGNAEALERVIKANEEHSKALKRERDEMQTGTDNYLTRTASLEKQEKATDKLTGTLRENLKIVKLAEKAEADYAASGAAEMAAKTARIKTVNSAYDESVSSVTKFIDKESGLLDVGAYLKAFQKKEKALEDYQKNLATVSLSPEAKAYIDSQGVEAAASFLTGYMSANDKQQAELNRVWSEAGKENSGEYKGELKKGLGGTVRGPRVTVETPNAAAIIKGLQKQMDKTGLVVKAGVYTRNGTKVI